MNEYVAMLINPKDRCLYGVVMDLGDVHIAKIGPKRAPFAGSGYLEDGGNVYRRTKCARTHTPDGVSERRVGQGLMLYSGMALAAAMISELQRKRSSDSYDEWSNLKPCVGSSGGRSLEASRFWESATSHGYAKRIKGRCREEVDDVFAVVRTPVGHEYELSPYRDGTEDRSVEAIRPTRFGKTQLKDLAARSRSCTVGEYIEAKVRWCDQFVETISAKDVLASGMVFDVSDELGKWIQSGKARWKKPTREILLGIRLEKPASKTTIEKVAEIMAKLGVSKTDAGAWAKEQKKPGSKAKKNPSRDSSWNDFFGDLAKIDANPGKRRSALRTPCSDPYCSCGGEGRPCAGCGARTCGECSCARCDFCRRLVRGRRSGGAPVNVTTDERLACNRCFSKLPRNLVSENPDRSFRRAERAWGASGDWRDFVSFQREQIRAGIKHHIHDCACCEQFGSERVEGHMVDYYVCRRGSGSIIARHGEDGAYYSIPLDIAPTSCPWILRDGSPLGKALCNAAIRKGILR